MGDCMMRLFAGLWAIVGNEGGFVHKSFLGRAVGGVVGGAIGAIPGVTQAIGTVRGLVGAIKGPARPTISRTRTARPSLAGAQGKEFGRQLKLGTGGPAGNGFRVGNGEFTIRPSTRGARGFVNGNGDCPRGTMRDPRGFCVSPISPVGAEAFGGEAVAGRYGAAFVPGSQVVDRATCLRGMQLGDDGLCYNKGQISNKQRMWPAGRKPLLTGGQMSAIAIAARAAKRVETTTKRLQKMGMLKKPAARRALPAGHRAQLVHTSDHK